jgi:hypothetical protein
MNSEQLRYQTGQQAKERLSGLWQAIDNALASQGAEAHAKGRRRRGWPWGAFVPIDRAIRMQVADDRSGDKDNDSGRPIMNPGFVRLVVCAAVRNRATGAIVCGVRHGDCLNAVLRYRLDDRADNKTWECGFCDQERTFLSRREAWKVADVAGQIRRPTGLEKNYDRQRPPNVGDEGLLFSENLY